MALGRYGLYGVLSLLGYLLLLLPIRLDSVYDALAFLAMFTLSQIVGLAIMGRVGTGNLMSIALSLGTLGDYVGVVLGNVYLGNILLGFGFGLYFIGLVGILGLLLALRGLTNYFAYIYSSLLALGMVISSLNLNAGVLQALLIVLMLSLSLYMALSEVYLKPSRLGLSYVVRNLNLVPAAALISTALSYMTAPLTSLAGTWAAWPALAAPLAPLTLIPVGRRINDVGLVKYLLITLGSLSTLAYVFNEYYVKLPLIFASAMLYAASLRLIAQVSSPFLYLPSISFAYALSTIMVIPLELALGFRAGFLAVGLITLAEVAVLRVIKLAIPAELKDGG